MQKTNKKKINSKYVIKKLNDILNLTHFLAESHPEAPEDKKFIRVLEFTFRRSTHTLLAIQNLSQHEELSDSCFILARKIIEDTIFIEYMIQEDKEALTETFNNFAYVQVHEELKLMNKLSFLSKNQKKQFENLEQKYQKIKNEFKKPNGIKFNSPFGIGFEDMLRKLKFDFNDKNRLLLAYYRGSSKIHLNPGDLSSFKSDKFRKEEIERSLTQSIIISIWAFSRLTTRYIEEIREIKNEDVYEELTIQVESIFDDYEL